MKKIILLVILLAIIPTSVVAQTLYPRFAEVIDLEYDCDIVTVDDGENLWEFYGVDDYFVGDLVIMAMDDNGTAEIADDIVVYARVCTIAEAADIIRDYQKNIFKVFDIFF